LTQKGNPDVPRWRSVPQSEIVWSRWGHDYVAYHRLSGKTHYLNAASEQLLTRILLLPKDAETVAIEFVGRDAGEGDNPVAASMTDMLEHFEYLGLVERL